MGSNSFNRDVGGKKRMVGGKEEIAKRICMEGTRGKEKE